MDIKRKTKKEVLKIRTYKNTDNSILPVLKFPALEALEMIEHCFSTRIGGVSEGVYTSMNVGFTRGDDNDRVLENYRRLGQIFREKASGFICTGQTHTTNIRVVSKKDRGNGVTAPQGMNDVDGTMTNEPGVVLSVMCADCVPLVFADPVRRAIAVSHSGWRGTAGGMGLLTVRKMQEIYGSDPSDIICGIGPSICRDCYEVSEDVAEIFAGKFEERREEIIYSKGNGKYLLDLWKINEILLEKAGIRKDHISTTDVCTCCNPALLFSHRAAGNKRGNNGAFIMLKER